MDLNVFTGATTDRRNSLEACRELCKDTKGCNYFTWKGQWGGQCWLKTGITRKRSETSTKSGPAYCSKGKSILDLKTFLAIWFTSLWLIKIKYDLFYVLLLDCPYDENTDYPGLDLNVFTGKTTDRRSSLEACRELCNSNKDCNYFTWKGQWGGQCWLKTGITRKKSEDRTISGPACRN